MSDGPVSAEEKDKAETAPPTRRFSFRFSPKARKCLLVAAGILGGLLLMLLLFRDPLIRFAGERLGSAILGVPVQISKFSSSLSGTVELNGVSIGNPPGYHSAKAFQIGAFRVRVEPFSLFRRMIVFEEVKLSGLVVDMEVKFSGSNLTDLLARLQMEGGAAKKAEKKTPRGSGKSVLIRKLDVTNTSLSISNSMLGKSISISMLPMHLNNVGGEGKYIQDVSAELLSDLLASIAQTSSGAANMFSGLSGMVSDGSRKSWENIWSGAKKLFGK